MIGSPNHYTEPFSHTKRELQRVRDIQTTVRGIQESRLRVDLAPELEPQPEQPNYLARIVNIPGTIGSVLLPHEYQPEPPEQFPSA